MNNILKRNFQLFNILNKKVNLNIILDMDLNLVEDLYLQLVLLKLLLKLYIIFMLHLDILKKSII